MSIDKQEFTDCTDGPSDIHKEDKLSDIDLITKTDTIDITREDIISKDAEITRLQQFPSTEKVKPNNEIIDTKTTLEKIELDESESLKNDNTQVIAEPLTTTPSQPTNISAPDPPPSTNIPQRPCPPKIPPQPKRQQSNMQGEEDSSDANSCKTDDSLEIHKTSTEVEPALPSQPVAPPRKKRQQKKVKYNNVSKYISYL